MHGACQNADEKDQGNACDAQRLAQKKGEEPRRGDEAEAFGISRPIARGVERGEGEPLRLLPRFGRCDVNINAAGILDELLRRRDYEKVRAIWIGWPA